MSDEGLGFFMGLLVDKHAALRKQILDGAKSCGAKLHDMRGAGFSIWQAADASMCVLVGDNDYTCASRTTPSSYGLRLTT